MSIKDTLAERGERYGSFESNADLAQHLKHVMRMHAGWDGLDVDQAEALEMIAHKISRILNGDPNYADSWLDIAGYASLIEQRLKQSAPQEPDVPEKDTCDRTDHITRLNEYLSALFPGVEVKVTLED